MLSFPVDWSNNTVMASYVEKVRTTPEKDDPRERTLADPN